MRVNDTFEIKAGFHTGHTPGLVVVLDTLLTRDPSWLAGGTACIRTPVGSELCLSIAEAKEHGPVNSLFFRDLGRDAIPVGCEITIPIPLPSETEPRTSSLAS
jgi:hypothetical protein